MASFSEKMYLNQGSGPALVLLATVPMTPGYWFAGPLTEL